MGRVTSDLHSPTVAPIRAVSGYGRARLYVGVVGVGLQVLFAVFLLSFGLTRFGEANLGLGAAVVLFATYFGVHALLQLPLDFLGGYILPRRYERSAVTLREFVLWLMRGVVLHLSLLTGFALLLLLLASLAGPFALWVGVVFVSLILLEFRLPVGILVSRLRPKSTLRDEHATHELTSSRDSGFTGGFSGILRPVNVMPENWFAELTASEFEVIKDRREQFADSGQLRKGRLLALGFTWIGALFATLLVGSEGLDTAPGLIKLSCWFTLWSFGGLLLLPTLSRSAVFKLDRYMESRYDPSLLKKTTERLESYQDLEVKRPSLVETIFHPIPSLNRRESQTEGRSRPVPDASGFGDVARTAIYLSWSGLSLLSRSVHCNVGRPALWVFLPL